MIKVLKCPICGTEFTAYKNAAKYCSAKCRRKATAKMKQERKAEEVYYCAYCGRAFNGRRRKYCCKECQMKANNRTTRTMSKRKSPSDGLSLAQVEQFCREQGITYGEYTKKRILIQRGDRCII